MGTLRNPFVWFMFVLSLLVSTLLTRHPLTKARDANPVIRSNEALAAGLYASAALQQYGPITAAMARDERETAIGLQTYPGARTSIVYLATISAIKVPVHYQGLRAIVPLAATRNMIRHLGAVESEYPGLRATIEGLVEFRVAAVLGTGGKGKRSGKTAKRGKRMVKSSSSPVSSARGLKDIYDCAVMTNVANSMSAVILTESLERLPAWPWGFPQGKAKTELRNAIADAFERWPPRLPTLKEVRDEPTMNADRFPAWCLAKP